MNAFTKVLVVVVLILSGGFAASQMILYAKRADYREKYDQAAAQLETQSKLARDSQAQLKEAGRSYDILKSTKDEEIARLKSEVETQGLTVITLTREKEGIMGDLRAVSYTHLRAHET